MLLLYKKNKRTWCRVSKSKKELCANHARSIAEFVHLQQRGKLEMQSFSWKTIISVLLQAICSDSSSPDVVVISKWNDDDNGCMKSRWRRRRRLKQKHATLLPMKAWPRRVEQKEGGGRGQGCQAGVDLAIITQVVVNALAMLYKNYYFLEHKNPGATGFSFF